MLLEYQIIATTRKNQNEDEAEIQLNTICTQLKNAGFDTRYKLIDSYDDNPKNT